MELNNVARCANIIYKKNWEGNKPDFVSCRCEAATRKHSSRGPVARTLKQLPRSTAEICIAPASLCFG